MRSDDDDLERVLKAGWQAVAARRDRVSGATVPVPVRVPEAGQAPDARIADHFPAMDYIDKALALAGSHELASIAKLLESILGSVIWSQNSNYDATNCSPEFLDGYAFAALSGPGGPINCAAPLSGFLLMAPHVTYLAHRHAPEEVYLIMTPGAQWQLDGGNWFDVRPGDLIFHQSWQWHAMRTFDDPLLAFAGWPNGGERGAITWNTKDLA